MDGDTWLIDGAEHAEGTFDGNEVRRGLGGGLASGSPVAGARTTHFHAARLAEFGDTVLAVTRVFDETSGAALRVELRAFAAAAPGRGALAESDEATLLRAPGAIAFAVVELASPADDADERRAARLTRCVVTDAAPTTSAARQVADWMRTAWETELAFGSWPAVAGTLDAFADAALDAPVEWATEWLRAAEHLVTDDGAFLKVLSPAWLEPATAAANPADAATPGA